MQTTGDFFKRCFVCVHHRFEPIFFPRGTVKCSTEWRTWFLSWAISLLLGALLFRWSNIICASARRTLVLFRSFFSLFSVSTSLWLTCATKTLLSSQGCHKHTSVFVFALPSFRNSPDCSFFSIKISAPHPPLKLHTPTETRDQERWKYLVLGVQQFGLQLSSLTQHFLLVFILLLQLHLHLLQLQGTRAVCRDAQTEDKVRHNTPSTVLRRHGRSRTSKITGRE